LLSFQTTTNPGCVWFATANQTWLTLRDIQSSSQTATVEVGVDTNNSAARLGSITVATPTGATPFSISQEALILSELTAAFSVAPSVCPVSSDFITQAVLECTFDGRLSTPTGEIVSYSWLIGDVAFSGAVLQNPQVGLGFAPAFGFFTRDVTLTIRATRGRETSVKRPVTFEVVGGASGPLCYAVSPLATTVGAAGGTFEFQVSVLPICMSLPPTWYPGVLSPTSSWATVVSPTSGIGAGTVRYTISPNTTGAPRSGVIRIFYPNDSVAFTITQSP